MTFTAAFAYPLGSVIHNTRVNVQQLSTLRRNQVSGPPATNPAKPRAAGLVRVLTRRPLELTIGLRDTSPRKVESWTSRSVLFNAHFAAEHFEKLWLVNAETKWLHASVLRSVKSVHANWAIVCSIPERRHIAKR